MSTLATPRNMRAYEHVSGIIAYSPGTGEECSATPGDYWYLGADDTLRDAEDEPMILVYRRTSHEDVEAYHSFI